MLTPGDFGLSDRHYRIRGHQLSEAMPDHCPAGHPLGKETVLLSNHPCVKCTGSSHRTWRCGECDACWIWPACDERPDWPEWPGVDTQAVDRPPGSSNDAQPRRSPRLDDGRTSRNVVT